MEVFGKLYVQAAKDLPKGHSGLGDIVLIDGSLIDAVLSIEQIACVYKLRWDIEIFFGWWKRHLKVYHLISRSQYGLMVQMLAGLITYILLAIYCHDHHNENVSVKRLREISINIRNEMTIEDIVANIGGEIHPSPNWEQSHANS
jgi:hypothetical protein